MTTDIDGKVIMKSSVYRKIGVNYSALTPAEEETQVIGRAITDSTEEFVEIMMDLFKKRNFSTLGVAVLAIVSLVLYILEIHDIIFIPIGLVVAAGGLFFFFQQQINSVQPEEMLVSLSRISYPLLLQKNQEGFIAIDGLGLQNDLFQFPSYLDNNIIVKSVASSGQAINQYQQMLVGSSLKQMELINKNPYQKEMREKSRVEIFVDQNLSPLKSATSDKNIKRFQLEIPTISSLNPVIDDLSKLLRNPKNIEVQKKKIVGSQISNEMDNDRTIVTVSPAEITNWIEGLDSWASEAEGQDIMQFSENLSEILEQTGDNLDRILVGLAKLIDITLPASRSLYRQYNNYLTCYDCSIDLIKEQGNKIDIKQWIKDKLLVGVLDDPIFEQNTDDFISDRATEQAKHFADEKVRLEDDIENSFGKVPSEYPFVLVETKLPELKIEENVFEGSINYNCPNCGSISRLLSIPRFLRPLGIAYATTFWENTKHMEERGDTIIRNVNEIKTSKQQRETGLAPLETNYLNTRRNYVSATAKLSKAERKYQKLQQMR